MSVDITIDNIEGLDGIIRKLENFYEPVLQGVMEEMQRAARMVETKYALQGGGNDGFSISISQQPYAVVLTASGEDVGFLEFGAGVFTEADEFASEVGYQIYPGSYSEINEHSDNPNARYFAKNGFWWYRNFRYTGLIATRGMQSALELLRTTLEPAIDRKVKQWIGS